MTVAATRSGAREHEAEDGRRGDVLDDHLKPGWAARMRSSDGMKASSRSRTGAEGSSAWTQRTIPASSMAARASRASEGSARPSEELVVEPAG